MTPQAPDRPPPARRRWAERDRVWVRSLHRASASRSVLATLVAMSWLADGIVFYVTILVLPWIGGPRGTACSLRMALLALVDLAIYRILKRHFARPRPFIDCPEVVPRARCLDEYSFPSGHVLHSVAFGTLLCAYYPGVAWLVWPFVALVAASRVVLGLHYPSDVIVGGALGWVMAASVLVLF